MSKSRSSSPFDPFDACFQRNVSARENSEDAILAACRGGRTDSAEDEDLEARLLEAFEDKLAAWPVEAAPEFADATVARIREDVRSGQTSWQVVPAIAAGLVACIAFALFAPTGTELTPVPAEPSRAIASAEAPGALPIDTEASQILALAQALDQPAQWLLTDEHLATLAVISE